MSGRRIGFAYGVFWCKVCTLVYETPIVEGSCRRILGSKIDFWFQFERYFSVQRIRIHVFCKLPREVPNFEGMTRWSLSAPLVRGRVPG